MWEVLSSSGFWAAVAAFLSAVATFLTWRAQVNTLHHTFRPDVALLDWSRTPDPGGKHERLHFATITNIGRDVARVVTINAGGNAHGGGPLYSMGQLAPANLRVGHPVTNNEPVRLWWSNVSAVMGEARQIEVDVVVSYWDAFSIRHDTTYELLVSENQDAPYKGLQCLASGVYLLSLSTESALDGNPNVVVRYWRQLKCWWTWT